MSVTQEFIDAVQSNKILSVRIMLKNSLLIDPTIVEFDEMEQYATNLMGNIYVEHDGENLYFDVSAWNENYLNQQMVAVIDNFSKERIDLLKSMVRYLYKDKVNRIRSERTTARTSQSITQRQVGVGVTVAGAALAVTGMCASKLFLTVGGVVVAAVGVALIVSDKEDS